MDTSTARFTDAKTAVAFVLAGSAKFTLRSAKTGVRFTFRVVQTTSHAPHFVSLLSGSDNEADYQYLGCIFSGRDYRHGKKSRIGTGAPSAVAFRWAWSMLSAGTIPASLEVWHEGRCGRCNRPLTDPASIASGIGPVCGEAFKIEPTAEHIAAMTGSD